MKWNWGTGIALSMGIFMSFLVIMVVKASQAHTELQYEDYYEQELDFQSRINALQNAVSLKEELDVRLWKNTLKVSLSERLNFPLDGYITLFRPNDRLKDLRYEWTSNSYMQALPVNELLPGVYVLEVHWTSERKEYLLVKEIQIPESW